MSCLRNISAGIGLSLVMLFAVAGDSVAETATFPALVREPARGVLLVAHPSMRDPNFAGTIVLLTDHGLSGSVGLVLNRESTVPVVGSVPELEGLEDADINLRYGGPLGANSIRLLVGSSKPIDEAAKLADGVYFVNSTALLRRLLTHTQPRDALTIHYYAGFAAWSPGQLDAEIARGDWYLTVAASKLVFADDGARAWRELVETLAGVWVLGENADKFLPARDTAIVTTVTNRRRLDGPGVASAYNRGHIKEEATRQFASVARRAVAPTVDMDQKLH